MATLTTQTRWENQSVKQEQVQSLWSRWIAFTDTQAPKKTLWFLVSLVSQGVLFLPIPALLMYYFNAPIIVLGITLIMFFANFIAGMGGSNIRVTLTLFAVSILTHLAMLLVFMI
jgi:hypothetical protein